MALLRLRASTRHIAPCRETATQVAVSLPTERHFSSSRQQDPGRRARARTSPSSGFSAESFVASLEKELLRRERFQTREQARLRVFWYIECFYNPRRRHSSLGMLSPIDYEHQQEAIAA